MKTTEPTKRELVEALAITELGNADLIDRDDVLALLARLEEPCRWTPTTLMYWDGPYDGYQAGCNPVLGFKAEIVDGAEFAVCPYCAKPLVIEAERRHEDDEADAVAAAGGFAGAWGNGRAHAPGTAARVHVVRRVPMTDPLTPEAVEQEIREAAAASASARRYVLDQLDIMAAYGSPSRASEEEINRAVEEVARHTMDLMRWRSKTKETT